MPTPTSWSAWSYTTLSATDNNVNGLLYGTQWASNTISYSFAGPGSYFSTSSTTGYGPSYGVGEPWNGLDSLTTMDKSVVTEILSSWSSVANLKFVETVDSQSSVGDLRFAYSSAVDSNAQAHAYAPGSSVKGGDVWFNQNGSSYIEAWSRGSYEYQTVIHEIGHVLGLKHPFDMSNLNGITVGQGWDSRSFTVMSYSAEAGNQDSYFSYEPTTPMMLDILAMQQMYGANTTWQSGNTTYTFSSSSSYHQTIWDAGGIDTLVSSSSVGVTININEGDGSSLGQAVYVMGNFGQALYTVKNVWISFGTVIENATGGSGNDALIGNPAKNVLNGGLGNDTMTGGDGSDTYYVNSSGDRVVESNASTSTGGSDRVYSSLTSYTLGTNVENGVVNTTLAANMTGNGLNNMITAGAGNNVLNAGSGTDTADYSKAASAVTVSLSVTVAQVTGGSGSDTLLSFENLTGSGYSDNLTGTTGANTITGGAGADRLAGLAGADRFVLNSRSGSDTFTDFASASDKIFVSQAGIRVGDGDATLEGAITKGGPGGFSTSAELIVITGNISGTITESTAAAKIGSATSAYATGRTALFVVDNGSSSELYLFTSSSADSHVTSSELSLLATLSATPSMLTSDFLFGA